MTRPDLTDYVSSLQARNLAENTIISYCRAIRQFYTRFSELTAENLQLYKLFLLEHYKPQTANLRIRALNSYLQYISPSLTMLSCVKLQQKPFLENVISQADYTYLLRRLYEDQELTYYFLIRLIAATGVRVSELISFQVEDAFQGQKDLISKGNKSRRIYIPIGLQRPLLEWLNTQGRHSGALFLSRRGTPVTDSAIRFRLRSFAARYGLDPTVMHPHAFRHRFAKNFIERSSDIALLSNLLGHESLETTRIYLRRSSGEQAAIVSRIVRW